MVSFCLLSLNVLAVAFALLARIKKTDILTLFAKTVFYFFGEYILVSALFFALDRFQVNYVLALSLALNVFVGLRFYLKAAANGPFKLKIDPPTSTLYVILLVVATVFSFNRFEFFGMGQDQGVYQTKAVELAYGDASRQLDFTEYGSLESENQKAEYREFVSDLLGFDNYDPQKPFLNSSDELSPVSGIFHGIPTFPAILALAISAFGLENMLVFQTVFYLALLVFALKICENFKFSKLVGTIVVVAALFSPVMLWVAKAALTEMFLALLIGVFIYYLTSDREEDILKSTLPVMIFSFFHISVYTIIPEIIVLYWLLYLTTRNRTYLKSNYLAMFFFAVGYLFMLYITPTYSYNNSRVVYFGPLNDYTLIYFTGLALVGCLIANFILGNYFQSFRIRLDKGKLFDWLVKIAIGGMLVYTAFYGYKLVNGLLEVSNPSQAGYYGKLAGLKNISIVSYAYLTGGIILPVVFWKVLTKTKTVLLENKNAAVLFMFLYNVLFTSTFLRKEMFHYYYYSRYLAPFLLIVVLVFGLYAQKFARKALVVILVVVSVYYGYYGYVMIENDDDSRITYSMIEEIAGEIDENSAVIMANSSLSRLLTWPIKSMAAANIYPVFDESLGATVEFLEDRYQDVYVLASDEFELQGIEANIIYVNGYQTSQDLNGYRNKLIPLPQAFTKENIDVILAKAITPQTLYSMSDDDVGTIGFGSLEGTFRWTVASEAYVNLYLEKGDYDLVVNQLPVIPFENLTRQSVNIDFYINDVFAGSYQVSDANNEQPIVVGISSDLVADKENVLKMVIETWSPEEFGVNDTRDLGIAVESIQFVKK